MHDPVLLLLCAGTSATAAILADRLLRRWRNRLTPMDRWAERHGLSCEKTPAVNALSPFEPLALVAPVVEVDRLIRGTVRTDRFSTEIYLAACRTGNKHRPSRHLIAIFASHPELPPLRVLPEGDTEAPADQGFVQLPLPGLPDGYRAESYEPLSRPLTQALFNELRRSDTPSWRVELRPGRMILATSVLTAERLDAMMTLGMRLQTALQEALTSSSTQGGPWLN